MKTSKKTVAKTKLPPQNKEASELDLLKQRVDRLEEENKKLTLVQTKANLETEFNNLRELRAQANKEALDLTMSISLKSFVQRFSFEDTSFSQVDMEDGMFSSSCVLGQNFPHEKIAKIFLPYKTKREEFLKKAFDISFDKDDDFTIEEFVEEFDDFDGLTFENFCAGTLKY